MRILLLFIMALSLLQGIYAGEARVKFTKFYYFGEVENKRPNGRGAIYLKGDDSPFITGVFSDSIVREVDSKLKGFEYFGRVKYTPNDNKKSDTTMVLTFLDHGSLKISKYDLYLTSPVSVVIFVNENKSYSYSFANEIINVGMKVGKKVDDENSDDYYDINKNKNSVYVFGDYKIKERKLLSLDFVVTNYGRIERNKQSNCSKDESWIYYQNEKYQEYGDLNPDYSFTKKFYVFKPDKSIKVRASESDLTVTNWISYRYKEYEEYPIHKGTIRYNNGNKFEGDFYYDKLPEGYSSYVKRDRKKENSIAGDYFKGLTAENIVYYKGYLKHGNEVDTISDGVNVTEKRKQLEAERIAKEKERQSLIEQINLNQNNSVLSGNSFVYTDEQNVGYAGRACWKTEKESFVFGKNTMKHVTELSVDLIDDYGRHGKTVASVPPKTSEANYAIVNGFVYSWTKADYSDIEKILKVESSNKLVSLDGRKSYK